VVPGLAATAYTSPTGSFDFQNLPSGNYSLAFLNAPVPPKHPVVAISAPGQTFSVGIIKLGGCEEKEEPPRLCNVPCGTEATCVQSDTSGDVCMCNDPDASFDPATGQCTSPGPVCVGGDVACNIGGTLTCTDVQVDALNCGRCNQACSPGGACVNGTCLPPPPGNFTPTNTSSGNSSPRFPVDEAPASGPMTSLAGLALIPAFSIGRRLHLRRGSRTS